jgi:hypothetical protein
MPYKFNEGRRHRIPKARYRVANWPGYDAALVRRGSLNVWLTEAAVSDRHAPATGERGGQAVYANIAIETELALRPVLHQSLRQIEGTLRSIADLLGAQIRIPDHTTFGRRGGGLKVLPLRVERNEPLHLLIDGTGVKIYGEGEWLDQKHRVRTRRRWRKLHLAVDAQTQEIAAVESTPDDVGDVSALPDLLDQIEDPIVSVAADGAFDGGEIYDEMLQRHPAARVVIQPRSTATLSEAGTTQRDDHLRSIAQHGRLGWQRRSGYGRRSRVETAQYRYKTIIGPRFHARTLPNQRTEAKIGCNVLNRMTSLGMPVSVRVK